MAGYVYETPGCAVEALLRAESLPKHLWEPCCGSGCIVRVLRAHGPAAGRDQRWHDRYNDIPRAVESAWQKFGRPAPELGVAEPIFDPWERYIVPDFPLQVLPPVVQQYVTSQAVVIGCDPAALAMAALTAISGALDHRFAVKMMRNGSWWEHPRLWTLLVGDPSRKKTQASAAVPVRRCAVRDERSPRSFA